MAIIAICRGLFVVELIFEKQLAADCLRAAAVTVVTCLPPSPSQACAPRGSNLAAPLNVYLNLLRCSSQCSRYVSERSE